MFKTAAVVLLLLGLIVAWSILVEMPKRCEERRERLIHRPGVVEFVGGTSDPEPFDVAPMEEFEPGDPCPDGLDCPVLP